VVTKNIKPVEMIIKSNRKIEKKPAGKKVPNVLQVVNVPDKKIPNDGRDVIKMERTKESIGIDENP
jgi:hypothetical protein